MGWLHVANSGKGIYLEDAGFVGIMDVTEKAEA